MSNVVTLEKRSVHARLLRGFDRRDSFSSEGKCAERFGSCSRLLYWFEARFRSVSDAIDICTIGLERLLEARDREIKHENLIREAT